MSEKELISDSSKENVGQQYFKSSGIGGAHQFETRPTSSLNLRVQKTPITSSNPIDVKVLDSQ